jgi:alkylation response protein AidB-like acyl-CoA dehydrogenase
LPPGFPSPGWPEELSDHKQGYVIYFWTQQTDLLLGVRGDARHLSSRGAFDRALDYAREREQFGRKIAEFQVTQHKLADMATKIEAARLLSYKSAWNFDQGRIDIALTSMAKIYAPRVAVEVCQEAIQILGGYGYFLEHEVERFY